MYAELYGDHSDVRIEDDFIIRKAETTLGTLYEVECWSLWRVWRLHAALVDLPASAHWVTFDDYDEAEAGDGVLMIHYWEDARDRVTTAGGKPPTSIRKPTNKLQ